MKDSTGRWNVDPTSRHQYRFWDGENWTDFVADNGQFATDTPPKSGQPKDKWVLWASSLCIVVVSILLALTAFSTLRAIRASAPAPSPATNTGNPLTPVSPTPQGAPPTSTPRAPTSTVSVIGGRCQPRSSSGRTADGSVAYCERLENTDIFLWSLYTGDIALRAESASVVTQHGSSVAVCMEQTGRTPEDCMRYLNGATGGTGP